jgi:hypothetical protein
MIHVFVTVLQHFIFEAIPGKKTPADMHPIVTR